MRGPDDCWLWTGAAFTVGYGQWTGSGQVEYAHRVSYELAHGIIWPGYDVHHECEVKLCVNPAHLVALTRLEHRRRHAAK